ncbi:hypothetical protein EVAR_96719_1 [Eumeta japonica]|uniref:Uncharacterized protein n=1 Tax=Eumeta variegata TaxID=151549 RepID=A0A4C1WJ06_EUMVA|nr:hypothetical protein EVAR_96719_1 [Eumeta japonica]
MLSVSGGHLRRMMAGAAAAPRYGPQINAGHSPADAARLFLNLITMEGFDSTALQCLRFIPCRSEFYASRTERVSQSRNNFFSPRKHVAARLKRKFGRAGGAGAGAGAEL